MKTNKYLLYPIILLFLTSCYIYKPYTEKEAEETVKNNTPLSQQKSIRNERSSDLASQKTKEQQGNINLVDEKPIGQDRKVEVPESGLSRSDGSTDPKADNKVNSGFARSDGSTDDKAQRNSNKNPVKEDNNSKESGIKSKLLPNKYYKITVLDYQYKIQVDKWEGDTLVSHKIRKPGKIYKHHMNDIQEEAILERRFSKPFSDLFTVGAYASGAAILLLLIL